MTSSVNRRDLLVGAVGLAAATPSLAKTPGRRRKDALYEIAIPDEAWRLSIDSTARWEDDPVYLPAEVDLAALPLNPPSAGWDALGDGIAVTLPATVEQFYWGKFGTRPYTIHEYAWAPSDPVPRNGAYRGVSWWSRVIDIPADFRGRRILLAIRGARLRAEVFLNRKLVGYSILEELPFPCALTAAADPGGKNVLAIRITNPGGRSDWIDGDQIH